MLDAKIIVWILVAIYFFLYLIYHWIHCLLGPTISYSREIYVRKVEEKKCPNCCQCPCLLHSSEEYPQVVVLNDSYLSNKDDVKQDIKRSKGTQTSCNNRMCDSIKDEKRSVKDEKNFEIPYKLLCFSYKDEVRQEYRLYENQVMAELAARQMSKGRNPMHHPPHKRGGRFHFHPFGHTIESPEGNGLTINIHFMYGDEIHEADFFQPDSDEVSD